MWLLLSTGPGSSRTRRQRAFWRVFRGLRLWPRGRRLFRFLRGHHDDGHLFRPLSDSRRGGSGRGDSEAGTQRRGLGPRAAGHLPLPPPASCWGVWPGTRLGVRGGSCGRSGASLCVLVPRGAQGPSARVRFASPPPLAHVSPRVFLPQLKSIGSGNGIFGEKLLC